MEIPDGWQLVPKEPTEEMLFDAWDRATDANPDNDFYRAVYRDMIAAAPEYMENECPK